MLVSRIRFQTSLRFAYKSVDSACRRMLNCCHDWRSFCLLLQNPDILDKAFVKFPNDSLAFYSTNIGDWSNILEWVNKYPRSYKGCFYLVSVLEIRPSNVYLRRELIYPNPSPQAWYETSSIFLWRLIGMNSDFLLLLDWLLYQR